MKTILVIFLVLSVLQYISGAEILNGNGKGVTHIFKGAEIIKTDGKVTLRDVDNDPLKVSDALVTAKPAVQNKAVCFVYTYNCWYQYSYGRYYSCCRTNCYTKCVIANACYA